MKSVMTHQFSSVPGPIIERSSFDRSHGYKTTLDPDYLVPVYVDEVLAGDTFNLKMSAFARLATPLKPVMDNIFLDYFFFFVPSRILWDNFKKFFGEQVNPGDSTDFLIPTVSGSNVQNGTLWDYFGLPTNVASALTVSALPFRGMNAIYNRWFRDQNLCDSLTENKGDGPDALTDYPLMKRAKRADLFTSCLPWPSKGPDTVLPLGTQLELSSTGETVQWKTGSTLLEGMVYPDANSTTTLGATPQGQSGPLAFGDRTGLKVDLLAGDMATVRALREAFQLARLFERDARGGTRFEEVLLSHFGNTGFSTARWAPEYLGGGSVAINIHPVAQTSGSAVAGGYTDTPQGNLSAFGTASVNAAGFTKSFEEPGYVFGIVNIRADQNYQQGIDKMWSRSTRYDFFWPALSHLSEEPIYSRELFADGTAGDDSVFGYNEKDSSYRYKPSKVTGKFRSSDPESLDIWHLAQDFASRPVLDKTFIESSAPFDRIVAVPSEPKFLLDCFFSLKCARPMPVYSVPGMVDHF